MRVKYFTSFEKLFGDISRKFSQLWGEYKYEKTLCVSTKRLFPVEPLREAAGNSPSVKKVSSMPFKHIYCC